MSERSRPIWRGMRAAVGCLGELVFWWYVVPFGGAFVFLVIFEPDLFVVSSGLFFGVVVVIVVAALVVLLTASAGYLRAKRAAIESEIREEEDRRSETP